MLLGSMKPEKEKLLVGPDIHLVTTTTKAWQSNSCSTTTAAPPPVPSLKMLALTAPLIVKGDVKPEDIPPPVEELETAKIGLVNSTGTDDNGIVGPPRSGKQRGG